MTTVPTTPSQHPSAAILLAYASGALGIAHSYVVEAHAAQCPDCRHSIFVAEHAGGALLDGLAPTVMAPEALVSCFARLDALPPLSLVRQTLPAAEHWSSLVRGLRPRRYRWLAPGIRQALLFNDPSGALHLLRVHPEVALPPHSHGGLELACVLQGAFHDESGRYGPGDVSERDDADTNTTSGKVDNYHVVVAEAPEECVCILSVSGCFRFKSWLARLVQPFTPF